MASGNGGDMVQLRDDEYIVEKIVGKQVVGNEIQYLIKWAGYPMDECTWEVPENFRCPDLIAKFEEQRSLDNASGGIIAPAAVFPVVKQVEKAEARMAEDVVENGTKKEETQTLEGKDQAHAPLSATAEALMKQIVTLDGKDPQAILGANEINGKVVFLVAFKCQELESAGVVWASECNVKIPKLVIEFYESRIKWMDD